VGIRKHGSKRKVDERRREKEMKKRKKVSIAKQQTHTVVPSQVQKFLFFEVIIVILLSQGFF